MNKFIASVIIFLQLYCISYPSKTENLKSKECVEIYNDLVNNYQITRAVQIYLIQNSAIGFSLNFPTAPFYFVSVPLLEIILYINVERPKMTEWRTEKCE
jgi:hypothetical protein